jgi:hypothetical protein
VFSTIGVLRAEVPAQGAAYLRLWTRKVWIALGTKYVAIKASNPLTPTGVPNVALAFHGAFHVVAHSGKRISLYFVPTGTSAIT